MTPACESFVGRLYDGADPGTDAALAEHVGSCLECFRVLTELREVPRLRDALRAESLPDPGPDFWDGFPGRVHRAAAAARAAQARRSWSSRATHAIGGWLRRPLPAAFAGACVAAVVTVVVLDAAKLGGRAPAVPGAFFSATDIEGVAIDLPPETPPIFELDVPLLRAVSSHFFDDEPGEDSAVMADFVQRLKDDDPILTPAQRIETLDADALRAVQRAFDEAPI